ncbi:unnamed protein product [Choristocarpus tenellus]
MSQRFSIRPNTRREGRRTEAPDDQGKPILQLSISPRDY